MRTVFAITVLALGIAAAGCKKSVTVTHPAFPGTADGAKALLAEYVKPGADVAALSKSLRADAGDYATVFNGEAATKIQAATDAAWNSGGHVIKAARPTQTELLLFSATTDELKAGSPNCPAGYKDVAAEMKPGLTVYCFKFVEPGSKTGSAYDGLMFINGHWAMIPRPWHALKP